MLFISTERVWALSRSQRPAGEFLARAPPGNWILPAAEGGQDTVHFVRLTSRRQRRRSIYEESETGESISHAHATFSLLQIIPEQLSLVIEPSAGNLITERLAPRQVHPRRISRLFYTLSALALIHPPETRSAGRHAAVLAAFCVFHCVRTRGAGENDSRLSMSNVISFDVYEYFTRHLHYLLGALSPFLGSLVRAHTHTSIICQQPLLWVWNAEVGKIWPN